VDGGSRRPPVRRKVLWYGSRLLTGYRT